jgi:predicted transglutaminase-like cysteine proteinase
LIHRIIAITVFVLLLGGCAISKKFQTGDEVAPPKGCIDLLFRGGDCRYHKVMDDVSNRYSAVTDLERYGKSDYWANVDESNEDGQIRGDCEDFAIQIRAELKKLDIPSRLVLCQLEDGRAHMVAEADGWIFDNRRVFVVPKDSLPYKWIKISGYEAGDKWREIIE